MSSRLQSMHPAIGITIRMIMEKGFSPFTFLCHYKSHLLDITGRKSASQADLFLFLFLDGFFQFHWSLFISFFFAMWLADTWNSLKFSEMNTVNINTTLDFNTYIITAWKCNILSLYCFILCKDKASLTKINTDLLFTALDGMLPVSRVCHLIFITQKWIATNVSGMIGCISVNTKNTSENQKLCSLL